MNKQFRDSSSDHEAGNRTVKVFAKLKGCGANACSIRVSVKVWAASETKSREILVI